MEGIQLKRQFGDADKKEKPFKVCFVEKGNLGQSNIKTGRPLGIAPIVPLKPHDLRNEKLDPQLVEKHLNILKKEHAVDKIGSPKTENQKYGWYQVRLTDADIKDNRFYAHKKTNIIVREHLMNYAKIRT